MTPWFASVWHFQVEEACNTSAFLTSILFAAQLAFCFLSLLSTATSLVVPIEMETCTGSSNSQPSSFGMVRIADDRPGPGLSANVTNSCSLDDFPVFTSITLPVKIMGFYKMWRLVQTAKTVLGSCLSTGWRLITEKNLLPLKLGREATTWLNGSQPA